MEVELFNEFNEDLKILWNAFELQSNSLPFQSYEWQRYWNEQVGQPKYNMEICVIVCTFNSHVRAIFPFGINSSMGARVLSFLGAEEADYSAPLLAPDVNSKEFKILWPIVLSCIPPHDVVFFRNMPETINKTDNFLLENIKTKKSGMCYLATLPESFDDYSLRLSKSLIKDNRRMVRRLSEMGEINFKVIEKHEEFKKTIEILISQKEARYTSTGARNIFLSEHLKNFYKNMFTLFNRGFNVHLSTLKLDDEILATHLGIHTQDHFYYLMPTFNHDNKWKKFSLGRIHLERLIKWTIDNRIKKFDFTIGGESYKSIWCDSEMAIYNHFKIRSLRGVFYFIYFYVSDFGKSQPLFKKLALKILSLTHQIKIK